MNGGKKIQPSRPDHICAMSGFSALYASTTADGFNKSIALHIALCSNPVHCDTGAHLHENRSGHQYC